MTGRELTFKQRSEAVVRNYVRSVLVIDDHWPKRIEDAPPADETAFAEVDESREPLEDPSPDPGDVVDPEKLKNSYDEAERASLLAIEDAVLKEGVFFSGIRYGADAHQVAVKLARQADIVILDWHLVDNDAGAAARDILRELGKEALHFVCIFTGDGRISEVRAAIYRALDATDPAPTDGGSEFRIGNVIVAIRSKAQASAVGGESDVATDSDVVDGADLFRNAVTAIARIYSGFVQLGLVELVQRHREHLPKMLNRFSQDVDAAFSFEVSDETQVGTGTPFLQLVLDEWRASLEMSMESAPMQLFSRSGWEAFLSHSANTRHPLPSADFGEHFVHACQLLGNGAPQKWQDNLSQTLERLEGWLGAGMKGDIPWPPGGKSAEHAKWALLRAVMGPKHSSTVPAHSPLLELESLFCEQRQRPPYLTQGTVLRIGRQNPGEQLSLSDEPYLICTTPLCDAARPTKVHNVFTFVRADAVVVQREAYPGHGCVIHDGGEIRCLHIQNKPMITLLIENAALSQNLVAYPWVPGVKVGAETGVAPISLTPVSQLRTQPALALTESVSSEAARIGLDRVEFVRKLFKK